ncbi:MAG: hypothetical protein GC164_09865 [Phycisphaera sp.]|nr:hypothetical protein [Phycisphaera sp.]
MKSVICAAAVCAILTLTSVTQAYPILYLQCGNPSSPWSTDSSVNTLDNYAFVDHGDGSYTWSAEKTASSWSLSWDFTYNPDPYIATGNVQFNSNLATAQDFVIKVFTTSTDTIFQSEAQMFGSVTTAVVDSYGSNGATLSNNLAGDPIYTAYVGTTTSVAKTLLSNPTSLVAPAGLSNGGGTVSFGPETAPLGVTTNQEFGIYYQFRLTPGDTATFAGTFNIVPEPAALSVLALGSILLFTRRRASR